jgi:hypothetical protein
MKIVVSTNPILPIRSAAFSPRSYNPKAKVPISTSKRAANQAPFFMVLSALITDNSNMLHKTESKVLCGKL